jgi:hypothetical protein
MKRILLAAIILIFATTSFAAELKFTWDYTPEAQADIEGFKLYRDGTVEEAILTPNARTVVIPRQTDKKSHTYHLTAFNAEEESGPSATAIDVYSTKKPIRVEGTLILEVIE